MLATLKHYSRIYILIEAQYIKARMQYRADFIISSIGMIFSNVVSVVVFWVLFQTVPLLAGWTFPEILFIYGFYLLAVSPAQIFFDHIWSLRWHLIEGTFIKYYFRPLNMMFYYMSEVFDLKGLAQVIIGISVLVYASIQLHIVWSFWRIISLLVALFGASLVVISLLTIASSAAFWFMNAYPILSLAFKLREYSQYPMTIFGAFFRILFTYLIPIGWIAFYPSQIFLRPSEASWTVYLSPLVGIALFILAYRIWLWGVDGYTGTGS